MNFASIIYNAYVKEVSYLLTHTIHTLINDLFGIIKSCGLRGEGRRDRKKVKGMD